jgi:ketosteroid isomerase-like protein
MTIDTRERAQLTERAIRRLHAAVNARDAAAIAACCAEDVTWEDPAASDVLRGR